MANQTTQEDTRGQGNEWYWQEVHRLFEMGVQDTEFRNPNNFRTDHSRGQFFSGQANQGLPVAPLMIRPLAHFMIERICSVSGQVLDYINSWQQDQVSMWSPRFINSHGQLMWSEWYEWSEITRWEFGIDNSLNNDVRLEIAVGDILRFTDMSSPSGMQAHGGQVGQWHELIIDPSSFGATNPNPANANHMRNAINATGQASGSEGQRTGWPTFEIVITEDMIGDHSLLYSVMDWQRASGVHNPFSMHTGSPFRVFNRPGGNAGGHGNTSQNGNQLSHGMDNVGWFPGGSIEHRQGAFIRVLEALGDEDRLQVIRIFETWDTDGSLVERLAFDWDDVENNPHESGIGGIADNIIRNQSLHFRDFGYRYAWSPRDESINEGNFFTPFEIPIFNMETNELNNVNNQNDFIGMSFGRQDGYIVTGTMAMYAGSQMYPMSLQFSELIGNYNELMNPQFEMVQWYIELHDRETIPIRRVLEINGHEGSFEDVNNNAMNTSLPNQPVDRLWGYARGAFDLDGTFLGGSPADLPSQVSMLRNEGRIGLGMDQTFNHLDSNQVKAGVPILLGDNNGVGLWSDITADNIGSQLVVLHYRRVIPAQEPSVDKIKVFETPSGQVLNIEHMVFPYRYDFNDDGSLRWTNPFTWQYTHDNNVRQGDNIITAGNIPVVEQYSLHDFDTTNLREIFITTDRDVVSAVVYPPNQTWWTRNSSNYGWSTRFETERNEAQADNNLHLNIIVNEEGTNIPDYLPILIDLLDEDAPLRQVVYFRYVVEPGDLNIIIIREYFDHTGTFQRSTRTETSLNPDELDYVDIPPSDEWFVVVNRPIREGDRWYPVRDPEINYEVDRGTGAGTTPVVTPPNNSQNVYVYIRVDEDPPQDPVEGNLILVEQRVTRRIELFDWLRVQDSSPLQAYSNYRFDRSCKCNDGAGDCSAPPTPNPASGTFCTNFGSPPSNIYDCGSCEGGSCHRGTWSVSGSCGPMQFTQPSDCGGSCGNTDDDGNADCDGSNAYAGGTPYCPVGDGGTYSFAGWTHICGNQFLRWVEHEYRAVWQNLNNLNYVIQASTNTDGGNWGVRYYNNIADGWTDDLYADPGTHHYLSNYRDELHNHTDVDWISVTEGLYPEFHFIVYRSNNLPILSRYAYNPFFQDSPSNRERNMLGDAYELRTGLSSQPNGTIPWGNSGWGNAPNANIPSRHSINRYNSPVINFVLTHDGDGSIVDITERVSMTHCDCEYEEVDRGLQSPTLTYRFDLQIDKHLSTAQSGEATVDPSVINTQRAMIMFANRTGASGLPHNWQGNTINIPANQTSRQSIQNVTPVRFYSFIQMFYDNLQDDDIGVYVMSDTPSVWRGNDMIEIGWVRQGNPAHNNLNITSTQWSGHARARDLSAMAGSNSANQNRQLQVLPGGAIFQVSHLENPPQQVHIAVRTYQTFIQQTLIDEVVNNPSNYVGWSGFADYRLAPRLQEHNRALSQVVNDVERTELQMWINNNPSNAISSNPFVGAGSRLVSRGMTGFSNGFTDSRANPTNNQRAGTNNITLNNNPMYWLNNSNPAQGRNQNTSPFFDALNRVDRVVLYRMVAEPNGVITIQRSDAGLFTGASAGNFNASQIESGANWINLAQGRTLNELRSNEEARLVDDNTRLIYNFISALEGQGTGGAGNNNQAEGALHGDNRRLDNRWMFSSFRSIGVVMVETVFEMSLTNAPTLGEIDGGSRLPRQAAVDPRLQPYHQGVSALLSYSFPSGFRSEDRVINSSIGQSTWGSSNNVSVMPNRMFCSNWFLVPNASVQDLR